MQLSGHGENKKISKGTVAYSHWGNFSSALLPFQIQPIQERIL
jgi:hypothetical protein